MTQRATPYGRVWGPSDAWQFPRQATAEPGLARRELGVCDGEDGSVADWVKSNWMA